MALRFLSEDPWERLAALRQAVPNVCLQMLLRGRNTVGYTPYPTEVTTAFVQEAAATGLDVFRIFDALNDVEQMRPAIEAVRETGTTVAEVALCYTGDLSSPDEKLYTLDYYLRLAERIVDAGAHVLAIKDMAGLLRAPGRAHPGHRAARAVRPAGAPAHPRHPGRPARHPARRDRRRGRRGRRGLRVDGRHDVPAAAVRAGLRHRPLRARDRPLAGGGQRAGALLGGGPPGLRAVRVRAALARPAGSTATRSPGGQLSNLRQQAIALGLGEKFEQVEDMYAAANDILGHIPKVTPSSKVVGDLALALVGLGADPAEFAENPAKFDIPDSVIGFLNGELGDPPGGWPEPFRTKALEGRTWKPPASEVTAEQSDGLAEGSSRTRRATLNELLFPGPTKEFLESRETYGDVSVLPTIDYLYGLRHGEEHEVTLEEGKTIILGLQAISEPDERGYRTVMATINGQLRPISVRDRAVASEVAAAEKADPGKPGHVAAPFQGVVTTVVAEGDKVAAGDVVATIEAMKMEASITAPVDGTVERLAISGTQAVDGGDLVLVLG